MKNANILTLNLVGKNDKCQMLDNVNVDIFETYFTKIFGFTTKWFVENRLNLIKYHYGVIAMTAYWIKMKCEE